MDGAVVTRSHNYTDRFAVVHLRAVRAGIEPVLLGIARDAVGPSADVTAAVLFVPDRRRKRFDVHVVPTHNVLENRSVVDNFVRDEALRTEIRFAKSVAQFPLGKMVGETKGHVPAF